MKRHFTLYLVLSLVIACQVIPTPPPLKGTPPGSDIRPLSTPSGAALTQEAWSTGTPPPLPGGAIPPSAPGEMPPFPYRVGTKFTALEPVSWIPEGESGVQVALPVPLEQVANLAVTAGLTSRQRTYLAQQGFVVIYSQEAQFSDIREGASQHYGQPYYLTSDAAYHALHLAFDETLKALEREELLRRLIGITQATLNEVNSYIPLVQGTFLEADTRLAAAYLGVGLKLLDPGAALEPDLEGVVKAQVEQIMAGRGLEISALIPNFKDDYSAYKPVGHYAGQADLEAYYRGMTWFGRVHFKLVSQDANFVPSRLPLIVTLALRRADIEGEPADEEWARVHETLSFLVGPSGDSGPAEYARLMDQVYGPGVTFLGLSDVHHWNTFLSSSQGLPPPQINSTFVNSLGDLEGERGWRFMGQRFSLDVFILQNLVFDKVSTRENKRELPSGLDVMAALGSPAAMQELERSGETAYLHYPEQMSRLQRAVQTQSESQWLDSAYSSWLYTFLPQVGGKGEAFPAYMRTEAWAYKDLNSALGSWAELKHDTTRYVEMPETAAMSEPPSSGPAPGYVEPNPAVFYRLAYLASAVAEGLRERDLVGVFSGDSTNLANLLDWMEALGERLRRLGDIAAKELEGVSLEEDDYRLIQAPLGEAEERAWTSKLLSAHGADSELKMPQVEVIATVAGAEARILHVGTGAVDRIYVIVPLEGGLHVAQGGLFSYYEFPWPRDERLSDGEWRQLLALSPPDAPQYLANYILPDGNPVDVLAFRVGDVYRITRTVGKLNVRQEPTRNAGVLRQIQKGDYVMIVDGPVQAEGLTWWKFRLDLNAEEPVDGWAVENADWYERAWGQ